jgi:GMP synthase (glutamine-hydrolysing)
MLGRWLVEAGCALDVRHPYAGQELPGDLDEHDALLVLGGAMGADDDAEHHWLGPTKQLVRDAVAAQVPVLGVCLGHQLIGSALGGRVVRNPRGRQAALVAVGWEPEAADDPLLGSLSQVVRAVHWNDDIVAELPPGAVRLASAPGGEVQAARHAPTAWGVQCHPEADAEVFAGWPGTEAAVEGVRAAVPGLESTWRGLGESLAALAGDRARARPRV